MKTLLIIIMLMISIQAQSQELRIWTIEEPPGNFTDQDGHITGLAVEFVREIQKRIGDTHPIQMMPWARVYAIAQKDPNLLFFSVALTPEREEKFHWIALVMRKPWTLYAKKGSTLQIKTLNDAKQVKIIGVMRGDVRADWLEAQGFTNLQAVTNHAQNIQKLLNDRVSLIFCSPQEAAHLCRKLKLDFQELVPVLSPHASLSYLAMSKQGTSPEIVQLWQTTAQQIKDDGTFQRLAEKWARYTFEQDGIPCEVKDGALNFGQE